MSQSNFFRKYLDILNEAPTTYNPKGVLTAPAQPTQPAQPQWTDKDQQDYETWSMADRANRAIGTGQSQMFGPNDPRAKFNQPVNMTAVQDKDTDTLMARQQAAMGQAAGSPEREQQFINKSMADTEIGMNSKVKPDESVQEDELEAMKKLAGTEQVEEEKPGLWANIHAKRERIKHGSGEHMRKPGSKGAPTADALRKSAK